MNIQEIRQICSKKFPEILVELDNGFLYFKNLEKIKKIGMSYSWDAVIELKNLENIKFQCEITSYTSGTFKQYAKPPQSVKTKFENIMDMLSKAE